MPFWVELDLAIVVRFAEPIAEDSRATGEFIEGAREGIAAEEDAVAEDEGHWFACDGRMRR